MLELALGDTTRGEYWRGGEAGGGQEEEGEEGAEGGEEGGGGEELQGLEGEGRGEGCVHACTQNEDVFTSLWGAMRSGTVVTLWNHFTKGSCVTGVV